MGLGDQSTQKLVIIVGEGSGTSFKFDSNNKSKVIEVCFNPTQFTLGKSNTFKATTIPGLESPIIQFAHGEARTLTLKLLLDTYATGDNENLNEKYINRFDELVEIDSDLHAPPPCQVLWGELNFVGVVEKIDKEYILFLNDGKPVRAWITLTLKEYVPIDIQTKGSPLFSPDRRKVFTIKEGDSLWQLANRAYGDPAHWRVIAEANNIDRPRDLEIGKAIIVPVLKKRPGS